MANIGRKPRLFCDLVIFRDTSKLVFFSHLSGSVVWGADLKLTWWGSFSIGQMRDLTGTDISGMWVTCREEGRSSEWSWWLMWRRGLLMIDEGLHMGHGGFTAEGRWADSWADIITVVQGNEHRSEHWPWKVPGHNWPEQDTDTNSCTPLHTQTHLHIFNRSYRPVGPVFLWVQLLYEGRTCSSVCLWHEISNSKQGEEKYVQAVRDWCHLCLCTEGLVPQRSQIVGRFYHICALSSFDDIAGEYDNFVVKASEKKAGFNKKCFQESFSEVAECLLLKSGISKGMTLSLGRHHICSYTLLRIQAATIPPDLPPLLTFLH